MNDTILTSKQLLRLLNVIYPLWESNGLESDLDIIYVLRILLREEE